MGPSSPCGLEDPLVRRRDSVDFLILEAEHGLVDIASSFPPEGEVRLLLVDDDELVAAAFGRLLKNAGYDVTCAGNGRQALGLASEKRFDLVISDV